MISLTTGFKQNIFLDTTYFALHITINNFNVKLLCKEQCFWCFSINDYYGYFHEPANLDDSTCLFHEKL